MNLPEWESSTALRTRPRRSNHLESNHDALLGQSSASPTGGPVFRRQSSFAQGTTRTAGAAVLGTSPAKTCNSFSKSLSTIRRSNRWTNSNAAWPISSFVGQGSGRGDKASDDLAKLPVRCCTFGQTPEDFIDGRQYLRIAVGIRKGSRQQSDRGIWPVQTRRRTPAKRSRHSAVVSEARLQTVERFGARFTNPSSSAIERIARASASG